jgi:glutamyl-Q tRNA(Asp) synthetase
MPDPRPVFRFAPSPNGHLHLGHAFSALFSQRMARRAGGRLLLRIEDTDLERSRPEFEEAIYEDLAWLGIEWETPVRRQSEHLTDYEAALRRLKALGVTYPCFASRKEIAAAIEAGGGRTPRDPDGVPLYPGLHRNIAPQTAASRIAAGEPYAVRLNIEKAIALAEAKLGGPMYVRGFDADAGDENREAAPQRWGDVVLARKHTPAAYHIAVVVDDALQGITHVTRGMDLYAATDVHRLLQTLLDLAEPRYCHHRLILDPSGRKLAKSHRDKALRSLRAEGATPETIKHMVGFCPDAD